jgi:hypothetical protein
MCGGTYFADVIKFIKNVFVSSLIASPKGEANNRIRRKKKAMSLCMCVCNAPWLGRFTTVFRLFGLEN